MINARGAAPLSRVINSFVLIICRTSYVLLSNKVDFVCTKPKPFWSMRRYRNTANIDSKLIGVMPG